MHLAFEDAVLFRKYVDGIASLVEEAEFAVTQKGLALKATDASQVSLVDFEIPMAAFSVFELSESAKLGADLNYLGQIMGRAKAGDALELRLSDDKSKLGITFVGASRRTFSMPLLDLAATELPMPRIEYSAEVKLLAGALQDSLKDASLISTHILLSVEDTSFKIMASSSKGNLENVYASKDKPVISLKAEEDTKAMFPLSYLVSIVKAASQETEVTVKLKTNAPIEITYSLGQGRLQYFLAPRIDSE